MEPTGTGAAGNLFTMASLILGFISKSDVAAIMAIGAGAAGILLNATKWWFLIQDRRKEKQTKTD